MNLMIGTDRKERGGIPSVVSGLSDNGFLERYDIEYLPSHAVGSPAAKLRIAARCLLQVFRTCMSGNVGIVHVHAASGASFVRKSVFLAIARSFGCRTLLHMHSGEFHLYVVQRCGHLMRWWVRTTLEKSTRVIVLSDGWARIIQSYAPRAVVEVVPNGVDLYPLQHAAHEEHGRILFLGHVRKQKGIFELLEAVAWIKQKVPHIRLVIGGDGELNAARAFTHQLGISHQVEFLGWIDEEKKRHELMRASVFCLPSYNEGLPMAMLEAMSARKAVVMTAVGAVPETLRDGVDGLLVPSRNADALARALDRAVCDDGLRSTLAHNARKTVESRFCTDVTISKLSDLYSAVGAAHRESPGVSQAKGA